MLSNSSLTGALAAERERALRARTRDAWRRKQSGALTVREATAADATELQHLARLDSQGRPPAGRLLVALDEGVLVAALAIDSGAVIADPFRSTASIVAMLRLRAEKLREPAAPRARLRPFGAAA